MGDRNPPRAGEGDRAQRGGGGPVTLRRPEIAQARRLRREMSPPEVMLWQRIRGKRIGFKFRRQHPVGPYVADFFCSASKLIVEIDGSAHDNADRFSRDETRDRFFHENGYAVLRVTASDVFGDIDSVIQAIVARAESPLHRPSDGLPPRAGEEI